MSLSNDNEDRIKQRLARQSRSGSIFSNAIDDQTDWNDLFMRMAKRQGTIEEFKKLMYKVQSKRREFVAAFLHGLNDEKDNNKTLAQLIGEAMQLLQKCHSILSQTEGYQIEIISTSNEKVQLNIKDELIGMQKDLVILDKIYSHLGANQQKSNNSHFCFKTCLVELDILGILAPYHPSSAQKFFEEHEQCVNFLKSYITPHELDRRKPIMITDWDGTMKDYCSQYATNLQPIYSAISMAKFSEMYTRITAVLTAGPLRGPGILDLTSLPKDGPIVFGGSWGREWWLGGKRIVQDEGISDEGLDALERLTDEMSGLLQSQEFSQFGLVGSGVQRKVDRLTLGVQTVCKHIHPDLSARYQEEVKERLHRVDPNEQVLHFDLSTELEVEVVVHSDGVVWNKANGINHLIQTTGDSLDTGKVLICGDTHSDLPMVIHAAAKNRKGVMALFVTTKSSLRERIAEIVGDPNRYCFVSSPDVIHAAMITILCLSETSQETPPNIGIQNQTGTYIHCQENNE